MSSRVLSVSVLLTLLGCACSTIQPHPHESVPGARDFEASIARIQRTDPSSPALLNMRLAYAALLLNQPEARSCADRINRAQEEIASARSSPEARVMFPQGWALVADLEYRQHLARGRCGSKADRRDELLAAVEAARRSVERYRRVFDYHAMVVMQFDAAMALHRLGENTAALAALKTALRMDREYGFADDARQNYQLLLAWRGDPAGPAQVAALMRDFPRRRAVLKFGWHPGEARVTLDWRREFLENGLILRSRAQSAFRRRIDGGPNGGLTISYKHRVAGYQAGIWPSPWNSQTPQASFPPAPFPAVALTVSAKGELDSLTDSKALSGALIARTDELIRAGAPASGAARNAIRNATEITGEFLSPGMLEAETVESYQLETAMWIGATLEQGAWYTTTAALSLPGMPRLVIPQKIEFAFTRRVPCTAGQSTAQCVEIVLHAVPDAEALSNVLADFSPTLGTHFFDYDASTDARIIVDPATLLPYALEEQIDWYGSIGTGKGESILESQHLLSTTSYGTR